MPPVFGSPKKIGSVLHDVGAHVEEVPLVLDRDQGPLRAVVLRDLERLGQRPQRLDVALDAHVAEDEQRRARRAPSAAPSSRRRRRRRRPRPRRGCASRSITSTWRSETSSSRAIAELALLRLQVAERALDRLLHGSRDAAGELQLARAGRDGDLDAVEADGAVDVTPAL